MDRKSKSDKTTVQTNAGQLLAYDPAGFAEFGDLALRRARGGAQSRARLG
jgi:hypothetical protein